MFERSSQNSRRLWCVTVAAIGMSGGVFGALGQTPKSPPLSVLVADGDALARKLCVHCHLVPGTTPAAIPAGVPTLRAIATRSGQTASNIEGILRNPHSPMPEITLTNDEIRNLILYLDTLRPKGAPRLLQPPPGSEEPLFPLPS
jgi:mono/diheme cytochrome c family protein